MNRLKSRKLWVSVGAVLVVVGGALHGDVSIADALNKLVLLALGYLGAQGTVDAVSAFKS